MNIATSTVNLFLSQITPNHLWLVMFAIVFYAFVMSWILLYHWNNYGLDNKTIKKAKRIYLGVLLTLIILMTILIFLI